MQSNITLTLLFMGGDYVILLHP